MIESKKLNFSVKTLILSLFLTTTTPSVFAQNYVLDNAIQRFANDSALKHGQLGLCVMDAQTGQILGSHNATMSLIPASNMKIVTTAAGLNMLGADYTFKTELQYDGEIQDSILNGNIIIKGYGDPTLGSPEMDSVASMMKFLDSITLKIKELGIKKINGKIVGDGSAFDDATAVKTWLWEDLGNYYGAGPSGLNFRENYYELSFLKDPMSGSTPFITGTTPQVPDFQLINSVKTTYSKDDDAYIFSVPYAHVGEVRGTIPAGNGHFGISGAMPDPPYFAAWHLRKTLQEHGVEVTDSATTQLILTQQSAPMPMRKTFLTWHSPSLAAIVKRTNLESNNLYCETILRAIALQQTGEGTNEKGTEAVTKFWQSKGIDTEGFFMQDGSGLSPRNGITPFQLASMLRAISIDNQWFTPFFNSLPEAGKSGTMKNMFKAYPSVLGHLRGKSGTITRVRCYSGYATTQDGRRLIYSAMCNNFTCSQTEIRKKLEQFMADVCRL